MQHRSHHHPHLEVRTAGGKGVGIFAKAKIARGELLVVTAGRVIATADLKSHPAPEHPFQIEQGILLAPWDVEHLDGIFTVNHSCAPNAGLRGQVSLLAVRDIQAGDEICYDYVMTDSDPNGVETFRLKKCLCGARECRGSISDLDWRDRALQDRYRGHFSAYLAARIAALSA